MEACYKAIDKKVVQLFPWLSAVVLRLWITSRVAIYCNIPICSSFFLATRDMLIFICYGLLVFFSDKLTVS